MTVIFYGAIFELINAFKKLQKNSVDRQHLKSSASQLHVILYLLFIEKNQEQ